MIKPSLHSKENERLKELASYNILDTLPEDDYDSSEINKFIDDVIQIVNNIEKIVKMEKIQIYSYLWSDWTSNYEEGEPSYILESPQYMKLFTMVAFMLSCKSCFEEANFYLGIKFQDMKKLNQKYYDENHNK